MTTSNPLTAAHLVFHVQLVGVNSLAFKPLKVSLNGVPTTLNTRLVKNSLVAKLDHVKLRGMVELNVNRAQLSECGVKTDEIFILSNLDESCRVWQHLMLRGNRFDRSASLVRSADATAEVANASRRRTPRSSASASEMPELVKLSSKMSELKSLRSTSRCKVQPFKVDFRRLNFIREDFIIYPDEFNMGMCKGNCSFTQCNNNGIVRHLLNSIAEEELDTKEVRKCLDDKHYKQFFQNH